MKKLIALLLATVMVLSMFAACGTEPNDEPDGSQNGETASGETAGNGTPEVKKIIMTYATAGVEPPDLPKIQAAINEMTIRDIGVEVEFMPISVFELASTVPTKVISGEQIDIFMMAFTGTSIYEQMNLLLPLNDYINETNTPFIAANGGPGGVYDNTAENVYSIMLPNPRPVNGGFLISKADLEAAGLAEEYKDYDKITLEDLDKIFAAIKAVYPDKYPCGIVGSATRAGMTFVCDALGDSVNSGVLVGMDSTTVENFYASEPYKAYLEHVRDWYLKDYIPKDAATTDIGLTDYLSQGIISGYFADFKDNSMTTVLNTEFVYLQFMEYFNASTAPAANVYFGVPATAAEPEAATRFIDYMLSNAEFANTLTWGIEGEHWVVSDEEHQLITYADGVTPENNGYSYGFGFYMNRNLDGVYFSVGVYDPTVLTDAETIALAEGRYTKGYGAAFDSSAWTTQLQQINTVVAQYQASLETGSADLETVYPEFLAALEANGINEVIQAKQAWFDEWLANNS